MSKKILTEWQLDHLFFSCDDPKLAEARKQSEMECENFVKKWSDRRDWLEVPEILVEALTEYNRFWELYGVDSARVYYFSLLTELDQNNPKFKAELAKARHNSQRLYNLIQFFSHRLAKIPSAQQKIFLDHPQLSIWQHYLESIFAEANFLLSEEEEKILNLESGCAYGNWVRMTENSLAREERIFFGQTFNFPGLINLLNSPEEETRIEVAKLINEILLSKQEMAEAELNSILEHKKISDELRKTNRPDQLRHLSDDIKTNTVDAMLKTVEEAFDLSKSFYELKAKILNKKVLPYYERNLPVGGKERHFDYQEAVEIVEKTLADLDPELNQIFIKFITEGLIDVYPKTGKGNGAFCTHDLKIRPTYIMLNFQGRVSDILTLAHEVGHGINNELIKKNQPALYFDTPTSTAEVASTFFEDFALAKIREQSAPEEELTLLMAKLDEDIASIFRQVAAYRFEQELHAEFRIRGYLTSQEIGQLFTKWLAAYLGQAIELSPGTENWWIYWSHFRNFFYVYSYASGLLISKALQAKVRADKNFIKEVKRFLSVGTSQAPEQIFKNLGLEIDSPDFWQIGLLEIKQDIERAKELSSGLIKH